MTPAVVNHQCGLPDVSHILTVNTGSSSIRLAAFRRCEDGLTLVAAAHYGCHTGEAQAILGGFLAGNSLAAVEVMAHRVVHGGGRFAASCLLDAAVEGEIERLAVLAPLHNPVALAWIRAGRALLGAAVPQVAVFDTAFYTDLPAVARTYAIPAGLAEKHGLRRYGFHGLAHQGMVRRWCQLQPVGARQVISLQLGAGCSITASVDGVALDTSMGFSPLEGLMMATRPGDIDAGLLLHLQQTEGLTPLRLERLLNHESGLLGVSGESADMRALLASTAPAARLAVAMYCYRARKYVGAYLAVLGGADAILFGGGVGEHAATVREKILTGMEWCGIALDSEKNRAAVGAEARISHQNSATEVWVIPVDEATILAQEAVTLLAVRQGNALKED